MQINQLFYSHVPKFVRYAVLTVIAIVILAANGVYQGITTDMYSDLGVYAESYTMAANAVYIGMGASLIFYERLGTRFTHKSLVLVGLTITLLMSLVCATTTSTALTVAASLVLGFGKILALGEIYLAWLTIWSKKFDSARLYPFFYFIALAGLYFTTWLTAYFTNLYSWRYGYIVMLIGIVLCLPLAAIFFEGHPIKKKIPLYQLDIPGLLLFIGTLMLINYIVVYGKVEDWFASVAIRAASFTALITALLFVKREISLKRPFLNFNLFRKSNFSVGLILIVLLGVFVPATFQSTYSTSVLHFESIRNAELNLYLIPGILAGCIFSFFWYKAGFDGHLMIIFGFTALVMYHLLMYTRFVTDLNIADFQAPSFFKGLGLALLYISIGVYATAGFPFPGVLKAVGIVVMVRSFLAPGTFSGLYSYILYAERNRHLSQLAGHIDANEPMVSQQTSIAGFYGNIQQQASLTALKELSGTIILLGLLVIAILVIVTIYRRVNAAKLTIQ